jgi:hypothetical protein
MPALKKERLDGWKEISHYLNRDVRTCQRWEQELGLPVYRINQGSVRSKVFSYTKEIDDWFSQLLKDNNFNNNNPVIKKCLVSAILVIIVLAVFIGLFAFVFQRNEPVGQVSSTLANPVRWAIKGNLIAFYNIQDDLVWTKEIHHSLSQEHFYTDDHELPPVETVLRRMNINRISMSDIDGDKKNEVLCYLNHADPAERCIALVDHDSRDLWTRSVRFDREYAEGKIANDLFVTKLEFADIDGDRRKEILVLWTDFRRFPSIFLIYDLEGNQEFRYEHTGCLQFFQLYSWSGREEVIFFGGTNNLLGGDAVLGVLDCGRLKSGLGPPYEVPPDLTDEDWVRKYVPIEPEEAGQSKYIRFRKNDVSRLNEVKWMFVLETQAGENEIFVHVNHGLRDLFSLYYVFDPDLKLKYVSPGAEFERYYNSLVADGKMILPLGDFLKTCERDVQFWDGQGWVPAFIK